MPGDVLTSNNVEIVRYAVHRITECYRSPKHSTIWVEFDTKLSKFMLRCGHDNLRHTKPSICEQLAGSWSVPRI